MKQETQWTTIFWEGWTAQALCAAAVFWPAAHRKTSRRETGMLF